MPLHSVTFADNSFNDSFCASLNLLFYVRERFKSMKYNKTRLALIIVVMCVFFVTNVSAEVSIIQSEIDTETDTLILKGVVSDPLATDRVTIEILNPSTTIDDIGNITAETFGDVFENIAELKTDGDGIFKENMKMRGKSGFYSIRVKENNVENSELFEDCFFYYSKSQSAEILQIINSTATSGELYDYLNNNISYLYINNKSYDKLSSAERLSLCDFIISSRGSGFSSIEDACNCISWGILSQTLAKCTQENEAQISFYENSEYIGFNESSSLYMPFYEIMSESSRKEIINEMYKSAPFENRQNFKNHFYDPVILSSIELCKNHSQIEDVLMSNADYIGSGINVYADYSDKTAVNKSLIGKKYNNMQEVISAINEAIAQNNVINQGSGTGSSGGSGGPGFSVQGPSNINNQGNVGQNNDLFTDIEAFSWAKDSINALYKRQIISGKGNNLFCPADNVTREEMTKMIISAFLKFESGYEADFSDVSASSWSYPYIAFAVKNGIVSGKGNNYFGATENITREDMALMLYRCISDKTDIVAKSLPTDIVNVSDYAREAVEYMYSNGIIKGYSDGSFAPKSFATRAEVAVLIARMCKIAE